jgi:CubicO group peptidase (beta-lactamase class C family)
MARMAGSDDGPSGHSMMRKLACRLCPLAFAVVLPLAALAQGMPAAEPESLGLSTKRLERIAPALRRDIAAGLIPGAVMLVARRGKLAYFEAFGMRDKVRNASMPRDAIFRLGSMTKPITIAAAMMLVEEGRLSLGDPISKYLPQFAHMQVGIEVKDPATGRASLRLVPSEREIRVEDMMRHTSGFTYEALGTGPIVKEMYRDAGIGPQDDSAAAMVEKLARLPLMYQPGTVWEYGRSIDVLGSILELLSGMPLSEFLAKRVFGPLRMPDTGFWVPPKKHNRVADVLPAPPEGRRLLLDVSKPPNFESGGGGLVSTAADYARFLQMLLNGGEIDGVRLLSRKSVELITTNQLGPEVNTQGWAYYPGPGYGFGLGFAVRLALGVAPQIGSPGDYFVEGLYGTFAFADPREQLLAVFMIQSQEWRYYRPLVKALVLQSLTD